MPENPRQPPRPRKSVTSYSEIAVRPETLRTSRGLGPPSSLPPSASPMTKAERDAEDLRQRLERAEETIARQNRWIETWQQQNELRDEASTPSKRARAEAVTSILKTLGMPTGLATAIGIAVLSYLRPAAKPEEVNQIKTEVVEKRQREVRKDSAESTYDTLMRTALECRFAQLAKFAQKNGYELEWEKRDGVVFIPNEIAPNARGRMVEVGPWRPRVGSECPAFPEKPSR